MNEKPPIKIASEMYKRTGEVVLFIRQHKREPHSNHLEEVRHELLAIQRNYNELASSMGIDLNGTGKTNQ